MVRDRTEKPTDFNGHSFLAGAGGLSCPCLPCCNVHDCGYYGHHKWVERWDCAVRFNGGCPRPTPAPNHIFRTTKNPRRPGSIVRCRRCGQRITIPASPAPQGDEHA